MWINYSTYAPHTGTFKVSWLEKIVDFGCRHMA